MKYTTEIFIKKAKAKYGNRYGYDKVEFIKSILPVTIFCNKCKKYFNIRPDHFLSGHGCQYCSRNHKYTTDEWVEKAKTIFPEYDYSKVNYVNEKTDVRIICQKHGEFLKNPKSLLKGHGCNRCSKTHRYTTEEWVERAKKIHGNKYDYSKVKYINEKKEVCIICPEHGEFWQRPNNHIFNKQGCPICNFSHMESEVNLALKKLNIDFKSQHRFEDFKKFPYDFYIPDRNIIIECQGEQHFKPTGFGKKDKEQINKAFKKIQENDLLKNQYCQKNGLKIIYL